MWVSTLFFNLLQLADHLLLLQSFLDMPLDVYKKTQAVNMGSSAPTALTSPQPFPKLTLLSPYLCRRDLVRRSECG